MNESTIDDEDRGHVTAKIIRCLNIISENLKIRELIVLVKDLNESLSLSKPPPKPLPDRSKQQTPSFNLLWESTSSMSDVKI